MVLKMQVQFEMLIIPYLLAPSEPGTESKRQATLIKKLREQAIAVIQRMDERIKTTMMESNGCNNRITSVLNWVRLEITGIRYHFGNAFSYFPLFFECEKYEKMDNRSERFNESFTSIIHSLTQDSGELRLPLHLIPGVDSVKSAIVIVQSEKAKLLEEASGWANNDAHEYEQLLNQIWKTLMKQVLFIYVSQL